MSYLKLDFKLEMYTKYYEYVVCCSEMCSLSSQILLHLNTQDTSGVYHQGEPEHLALCHLARHHARHGHYTQALHVLKMAGPTEALSGPVALCQLQLVFQRALYQGQWDVAQQAINSLASLSPQESTYRFITMLARSFANKLLIYKQNSFYELPDKNIIEIFTTRTVKCTFEKTHLTANNM